LLRGIILSVFFFSLQYIAVAQSRFDSLDFSDVDSFVLSVKYDNDIGKLSRELTTPYAEDVYKLRAIFKWITNNIEYDYRFINSGKELTAPDCDFDKETEDECIQKVRVWENNTIRKTLQRKKTIAEGYAKLFKKLCDINYIQCEVVSGYARTRPYQIGNNMPVNHTWNAVMIDADWYYLDITWAAGYCPEDEETGRLLKYVKDFTNYYWLSTFPRFSRNHYPKKGNFVEPTNLTKEQFFLKPFYYSAEVLENITEYAPSTGVLKVKKGDTIHFKFDYKQEINLLQVNSNIFRNPALWTTIQISKRKTKLVRDTWAEKKQQYIPFKKEGTLYEFDYPVTDNSMYYVELVFDYKQAVRYRIRVEN
jgi:hypothetical protein